jgi:hypothetical protein
MHTAGSNCLAGVGGEKKWLCHPLKTAGSEGFQGVMKVASLRSSDWNRIEEWLRNMERLRISEKLRSAVRLETLHEKACRISPEKRSGSKT